MTGAEQKLIDGMIDAALQGAHIALLRRQQNVQVKNKADGTQVTAGDYQSQQVIEATLKKLSDKLGLDDVKFLMEEHINDRVPDFAGRNHGYHWVVDPIDGTYGYSRKLGEKEAPWAVSISLEKDGKTIAGVVYRASPTEYGTDQADFRFITPTAPQGKIYCAHKNWQNAYKLEGGFRVVPAEEPTYKQCVRKLKGGYELPILDAIPKLETDFSKAKKTRLDHKTKIMPGAKPYIDGFFHDGERRNTATRTRYKKQFCEEVGLKQGSYDDCRSAVEGSMRAAEGEVSAFVAGRCFPWDTSATRLIMEKSGIALQEYPVAGNHEGRTTIIAGRDRSLVNTMDKVIRNMRTPEGEPIVNAPEKRGFKNAVTSILGIKRVASEQKPDKSLAI